MEKESGICNLIFECGRLKRIPRSGWLLAGVANCETVAEHTFRVAIIGYVLAIMEEQDPEKILSMCLLHDLPETRLGDIDAVGKKYLTKNSHTEKIVIDDQFAGIRDDIREKLSGITDELFIAKKSAKTQIVSDADKLECFIQALEYKSANNGSVDAFLTLSEQDFHTNSAKQLFREVSDCNNPNKWWANK